MQLTTKSGQGGAEHNLRQEQCIGQAGRHHVRDILASSLPRRSLVQRGWPRLRTLGARRRVRGGHTDQPIELLVGSIAAVFVALVAGVLQKRCSLIRHFWFSGRDWGEKCQAVWRGRVETGYREGAKWRQKVAREG
jgi:hypothetical protein